ncbi:MAG: glycosyltransferase [Verrucomicrobia bacterium]|nr:glycosyltransferase [Verrucomicrobiota bacterium]
MIDASSSPARRLRVAFFSDSFPERNGTGAYYHDLLGQLEPYVEALEIFQPLEKTRHFRISIPMPGDPSQRLISPNPFRIAKGCKAFRPDLVIAATPGPFGLLGLYHAKRHRAAFISAFHTDFEQLARLYWRPFTRFLCNTYLRNANRILCKSSATVLVNNSKLVSDVQHLGARFTEIMGTPLQGAFLEKPLTPAPPRVERICFAGRLADEKNVDRIIEAAADFPHVQFDIGGDGPERAKLEAAAEDLKNVHFKGWLTREQLIELIDGSSCLLLPSKLETFGSVALEAMARGRPALVSANAGIHEWPQLNEGLIALPPDQSLSDAIQSCLDQPPEYWQGTSEAARHAAEQLNQSTLEQWARVLAKYANPPRP